MDDESGESMELMEELPLIGLTHTHPFNGPFSRTTQVSRYQKDKTNLDSTEARDSEWQWHQLGYMQICTSLQTNNNAGTPPLGFLQAGCPSCRPTNSVKALKAPSQLHLRKELSKSVDGYQIYSMLSQCRFLRHGVH